MDETTNPQSNSVDEFGDTPLHIAIRQGHEKDVEALIQSKGLDLNRANSKGLTALHLAARHGLLEVVKLLLAEDVATSVIDNDGNTPLYLAMANFSQLEIVMLLLDRTDLFIVNKQKRGLLHAAAKSVPVEITESLIKAGLCLSAPDHNGDTPLLLALHHRNEAAAKSLIWAGADLKCVNRFNESALSLSTRRGDLDIVNILISAGVELSLVEFSGDTPLIIAICYSFVNRIGLALALIAGGADVTSKIPNIDKSLVLRAAEFGYEEVVTALLAAGADSTSADIQGFTPVHRLVMFGWDYNAPVKYANILSSLLDCGADVDALTNNGKSVWDLTIASYSADKSTIMNILRAEVANPHTANQQ